MSIQTMMCRKSALNTKLMDNRKLMIKLFMCSLVVCCWWIFTWSHFKIGIEDEWETLEEHRRNQLYADCHTAAASYVCGAGSRTEWWGDPPRIIMIISLNGKKLNYCYLAHKRNERMLPIKSRPTDAYLKSGDDASSVSRMEFCRKCRILAVRYLSQCLARAMGFAIICCPLVCDSCSHAIVFHFCVDWILCQ